MAEDKLKFLFSFNFIPKPRAECDEGASCCGAGTRVVTRQRERDPSRDNLEIGEFLGARRHGDNNNIYCEFCLFMLLTLAFM